MKYKVTKLYLKSKETLIAAFVDFNDARIFINLKLSSDERNTIKALYRIYDDLELVNEFNNEVQAYAEPEDPEAYSNAKFSFNVKKQDENSLDRTIVGYFKDKEDAKLLIVGKYLNTDKAGALDTYMIFKDRVLIATLNKYILDNKALQDQISSGTGKGATLSPLSTRPTPLGGPGDYWKEQEDDN